MTTLSTSCLFGLTVKFARLYYKKSYANGDQLLQKQFNVFIDELSSNGTLCIHRLAIQLKSTEDGSRIHISWSMVKCIKLSGKRSISIRSIDGKKYKLKFNSKSLRSSFLSMLLNEDLLQLMFSRNCSFIKFVPFDELKQLQSITDEKGSSHLRRFLDL